MVEVTEAVQRQEIIDILCDICGFSCKTSCDIEHATLYANWGYHSQYDTQDHECHICAACYEKVKTFIESLGGKIRVITY